jgi:hypothetical protein
MEQLIADIYAVSDKAVIYSNDVRGKFTDELSERFMQEHELLDGIYHFLQNERSNEGLPAIPGRKLFRMSDVSDAKETECEEMAEEIMGDLKFLLKGIESFAKESDLGVRTYLGGKAQEIKDRITFYRNFLSEDEEEGE